MVTATEHYTENRKKNSVLYPFRSHKTYQVSQTLLGLTWITHVTINFSDAT